MDGSCFLQSVKNIKKLYVPTQANTTDQLASDAKESDTCYMVSHFHITYTTERFSKMLFQAASGFDIFVYSMKRDFCLWSAGTVCSDIALSNI